MANTRIKICGITRPEDARLAADSGADAIGLVFYEPSPRCVSVAQAAEIAAAVPPLVSVVGLFVDESSAAVERILEQVPLGMLQFHGDESGDFCRQFKRPWMKALRVRPDMDLVAACTDYRGASAVLLDAWQDGVPGGTGKTFDWRLVRESLPLPMVLAGGLNAGNVAQAMAQLRPAAVDISGGVEQSPGCKDAGKISQFIAAVRAADTQLNGAHDDQ